MPDISEISRSSGFPNPEADCPGIYNPSWTLFTKEEGLQILRLCTYGLHIRKSGKRRRIANPKAFGLRIGYPKEQEETYRIAIKY